MSISTIGKKIIVAVTGLIMFGFVIGHLIGNLQVFQGPDNINAYAAFLKHEKPLLWGARCFCLLATTLQVMLTVQLNRHNRASRPIPYLKQEPIQSSGPLASCCGAEFSCCFISAFICCI